MSVDTALDLWDRSLSRRSAGTPPCWEGQTMKVSHRARAAGFVTVALLIGFGAACTPGGHGHAKPPPVKIYDSNPAAGTLHTPSEGFECCEVKEFGDQVQFAGTARKLQSATVTMVVWSRKADYPAFGDSTGFNQGLTLNLYHVGANDGSGHPTLGTPIATVPAVFHLPWQPDNDPNCSDPTAFQSIPGALDTNCVHGLVHQVTFDLSGENVTAPSQLVWGIAFDTSTYGDSPIGTHGPYDSLNVGTFGNGASVGTDVEPGVAWMSAGTYPYCDSGAGGTWTLRPDEGCNQWAGHTPEISFSATP
jgi:hypothetical protein